MRIPQPGEHVCSPPKRLVLMRWRESLTLAPRHRAAAHAEMVAEALANAKSLLGAVWSTVVGARQGRVVISGVASAAAALLRAAESTPGGALELGLSGVEALELADHIDAAVSGDSPVRQGRFHCNGTSRDAARIAGMLGLEAFVWRAHECDTAWAEDGTGLHLVAAWLRFGLLLSTGLPAPISPMMVARLHALPEPDALETLAETAFGDVEPMTVRLRSGGHPQCWTAQEAAEGLHAASASVARRSWAIAAAADGDRNKLKCARHAGRIVLGAKHSAERRDELLEQCIEQARALGRRPAFAELGGAVYRASKAHRRNLRQMGAIGEGGARTCCRGCLERSVLLTSCATCSIILPACVSILGAPGCWLGRCSAREATRLANATRVEACAWLAQVAVERPQIAARAAMDLCGGANGAVDPTPIAAAVCGVPWQVNPSPSIGAANDFCWGLAALGAIPVFAILAANVVAALLACCALLPGSASPIFQFALAAMDQTLVVVAVPRSHRVWAPEARVAPKLVVYAFFVMLATAELSVLQLYDTHGVTFAACVVLSALLPLHVLHEWWAWHQLETSRTAPLACVSTQRAALAWTAAIVLIPPAGFALWAAELALCVGVPWLGLPAAPPDPLLIGERLCEAPVLSSALQSLVAIWGLTLLSPFIGVVISLGLDLWPTDKWGCLAWIVLAGATAWLMYAWGALAAALPSGAHGWATGPAWLPQGIVVTTVLVCGAAGSIVSTLDAETLFMLRPLFGEPFTGTSNRGLVTVAVLRAARTELARRRRCCSCPAFAQGRVAGT